MHICTYVNLYHFCHFTSDLTLPVAVTNLAVTYTKGTNSFTVMWTDLLNVNDTNRGYRISYNFSALDTLLATDTLSVFNVNDNETMFQRDIAAGAYGVGGVVFTVIVQACNNFGLGEPDSTEHTLLGGE